VSIVDPSTHPSIHPSIHPFLHQAKPTGMMRFVPMDMNRGELREMPRSRKKLKA